MDSTKSPNNTNNNNHNQDQNLHPNPLMHYPTSSEHGRTYAFNVHAISSQNTFISPDNTTLVQIPLSSFSSRNLVHGENSSYSSQPSWVNNSPEFEEFMSAMEGLCMPSDPGMEDIQSAMGGLFLSSDPVTRNSSTDLSSDYLPWDETFGCDDGLKLDPRLVLNNIRVQSAAAAYPSAFRSSSLFAGVGGNSNRVLASLGRGGGGYNNNGIRLERPVRKPRSSPPKVISMARDQCGCRLLQAKIEEGTPEVVQFILSQVKDHSLHLMTHPFGNYLIQKIFEAKTVSAEQIDMMLNSIVKDEQNLKQVCFNDHGTRAVQQVLKNLRTEWQVALVACVIRRITVPLMKNINASYVIEELLKTFPMTYKKSIFDEVARNCVHVATDRSGCSSIQRCMANAPYVDALMVLLEEIIANAAVLSQDQFGNYVVQYLIKLGVQPVISMIVSQLGGKYAQLCMNKYGSHVVEDLFKYSEERDLTIITEEIMHSTDFLKVLQDPYGNFVIQKALKFTNGNLQKKLVSGILSNSGNLDSHLYGKRVLTRAQRMQDPCI